MKVFLHVNLMENCKQKTNNFLYSPSLLSFEILIKMEIFFVATRMIWWNYNDVKLRVIWCKLQWFTVWHGMSAHLKWRVSFKKAKGAIKWAKYQLLLLFDDLSSFLSATWANLIYFNFEQKKKKNPFLHFLFTWSNFLQTLHQIISAGINSWRCKVCTF
jgi:hypothetical protein